MTKEELEKQAEPTRELIAYARERDQLGKQKATRAELIAALMILGRSRKDAERTLDNARNRVWKSANKAEEFLDGILASARPWEWTHPRDAIHLMRRRCFNDAFENAPFTDIEEALLQHGNALLIMAIYPALRWVIFSRLRSGKAAAAGEEKPRQVDGKRP